jgi:transcription initiation factor TFIIIB Brf1 subunit/transcription initiation factor TFIIB
MDGAAGACVTVCRTCGGRQVRRRPPAQVSICARCDAILDEAAPSDLVEFYAFTQTEEVHCVVVAADMPTQLETESALQASRKIHDSDEELHGTDDATQEEKKKSDADTTCHGECPLSTPRSQQQNLTSIAHQHHQESHSDDPFVTPGFITAFRMLAPLREPVYGVSARTMHGALAEMERILGDILYSECFGDNKRQGMGARELGLSTPAASTSRMRGPDVAGDMPDVPLPLSSPSLAPTGLLPKPSLTCAAPSQLPLSPTGVDTRNALIAYFEILDVASILGVDHETTNFANRIFRHVFGMSVSLRSRSVEALAAACLCAASERRTSDHHRRSQVMEHTERHRARFNRVVTDQAAQAGRGNTAFGESRPNFDRGCLSPRPSHISVDDVASAGDLDAMEVGRYLKHVNIAIGAAAPDSAAAVARQIPIFCSALGGNEQLAALAAAIAENAFTHKLCPRRNAQSVCSAAIYMSCQCHDLHRTQAEIARITKVTEVTLRKVHKELTAHLERVIPDWFQPVSVWALRAGQAQRGRPVTRAAQSGNHRHRLFASGVQRTSRETDFVKAEADGGVKVHEMERTSLDCRTGVEFSGADRSPPRLPAVSVLDKEHPEYPARARRNAAVRAQGAAAGKNSNHADNQDREPGQHQLLVALMQNPEILLTVAGAVGMIPTLIVPPPPPPPLPEFDNLGCDRIPSGLPWVNGSMSTSAGTGTVPRTQSSLPAVVIGDEANGRPKQAD